MKRKTSTEMASKISNFVHDNYAKLIVTTWAVVAVAYLIRMLTS